jgi:hypothetical protein
MNISIENYGLYSRSLWKSRLYKILKGKGSRNTNRSLSIGQITVKPIDVTRGKSEVIKLTKKYEYMMQNNVKSIAEIKIYRILAFMSSQKLRKVTKMIEV